MHLMGIFGIFYFIFILIIILFLASVVTKIVGTKYMKNLQGKNINVVESVSLGLDKSLYIVKVGNQHFLLSSSGKNIKFLSDIDSKNVVINPESMYENQQIFDVGNFSKYLEFFKNKLSKQKDSQNFTQQVYNPRKSSSKKKEENIGQNVEKIKDIFNSIKANHDDGVE